MAAALPLVVIMLAVLDPDDLIEELLLVLGPPAGRRPRKLCPCGFCVDIIKTGTGETDNPPGWEG